MYKLGVDYNTKLSYTKKEQSVVRTLYELKSKKKQ